MYVKIHILMQELKLSPIKTTGLVTRADHIYNQTLDDSFFDEDLEVFRATTYSDDWSGKKGGKMAQRYSPSCLRNFINDVISRLSISAPVYIKTRWTTSATSELYPLLVETPLLFGKDRPGIVSNTCTPSDKLQARSHLNSRSSYMVSAPT